MGPYGAGLLGFGLRARVRCLGLGHGLGQGVRLLCLSNFFMFRHVSLSVVCFLLGYSFGSSWNPFARFLSPSIALDFSIIFFVFIIIIITVISMVIVIVIFAKA